MFEELKRLANNVISLNASLIIQQVILNNKFQEFILDLNRSNQLFEGIDSLGVSLKGYSKTTETLSKGESFSYNNKSKVKKAGNPIFLFETGEFYKSFTLEVERDALVFDADAVKDDGTDLFSIYGVDILGLTDESTNILIEVLRDNIAPIIQEELTKAN